MAKATQAEAAITRQKIVDAAMHITLTKGFEHVTIGNLGKIVGISRSGVNCHFKKKEDLIKVLEPRLSRILRDPLDFSSIEAFEASWKDALETNKNFAAAVKSCGPVIPSQKGMDSIASRIDADTNAAMESVYKCIGYAVYHLDYLR